jgi:hypothetical protein
MQHSASERITDWYVGPVRSTFISQARRIVSRLPAIAPYALIVLIVTITALPTLRSGRRINSNVDYFQYASRYEAVRQSVLLHHTLPFWSHWFGGGVPAIGDPEDPTLNPLTIFSVAFGTVFGIKLISYLALIAGALGTYVLARRFLACTAWGAMYAALVWGTCLFVPLRLLDGNTNEIYPALLPLYLLLLALAREHKGALIALPFAVYTILADGKVGALMILLFVAIVAAAAMIPSATPFSFPPEARKPRCDYRLLKYFGIACALATLIGMFRFLPVLELIYDRGGLQSILRFHPQRYDAASIVAYTFEDLWKGVVGFGGRADLVTVGWIPVALSALSVIACWRRTIVWALCLLLFSWLALAHNAPVDLLRVLWNLPVFDTISRPHKYFTFAIPFALAVMAGKGLSVLDGFGSRRLRTFSALTITALSVALLAPKAWTIHSRTYTAAPPEVQSNPDGAFFQISALGLPRARRGPADSLPYFNVRRNVGTIDWYTGIPAATPVVPKYFVHRTGVYIPNANYQGEASFAHRNGTNTIGRPPAFETNAISVDVNVLRPDILIVNQNFHRDWRTDRGTPFSYGGLLAIGLREPGSYTVRLQYVPRGFLAGLAVTSIALAGLTWLSWTYRTGRLRRWSQRGAGVRAWCGRAILWAAR